MANKTFPHCSECKVPVRYRENSQGFYNPYCPDCNKEGVLASAGWHETNFPPTPVADDFKPGGQYDASTYKSTPLKATQRKDGSYDFKSIEEKNKANADRTTRDRSSSNVGVSHRYGLRPGDTPRGSKGKPRKD